MQRKPHITPPSLGKRRKIVEGSSTFGLLLICVALLAPFAGASTIGALDVYKWIYAAGALVFTVARAVSVNEPSDSLRLRRLRRMEFWAGMAFVAGAALWFYHREHLGPYAGVLAMLKDTIMLTLAGASLQIVSSWLIVSQTKKEQGKK